MAALTADAPLRIFGMPVTKKFTLDSTAARTWYRGEAVVLDQTYTPDAAIAADLTHPHMVATDVFLGIAAEGGYNAAGAAEDLAHGVETYVEPTIVGFKSAVFTNADIGATVYYPVSLLSSTATDAPQIGKIMFVEDGYIYVKLITAVCASTG
jgi:hypothetical protein